MSAARLSPLFGRSHISKGYIVPFFYTKNGNRGALYRNLCHYRYNVLYSFLCRMLYFNCGEFDIIKNGIINFLSDADKFKCIPVAQPIRDKEITVFGTQHICQTNIVLVIDFNDVYFGIFYCNLCHSTTDCRNFSRKDTNNSWNYIRWMNYLRPAGDGCRHDRPNRRRQPAELSLRRGEGRARNLGFPSLELFNDYSSNSTEIQLANLRAISYGHRFRHNDPIGKRCRLHSSY